VPEVLRALIKVIDDARPADQKLAGAQAWQP
jgi:hypothetical protein